MRVRPVARARRLNAREIPGSRVRRVQRAVAGHDTSLVDTLGKETCRTSWSSGSPTASSSPSWNRNHVAEVQITVARRSASKRARLLQEAGALRDMMQNHLLQLLCLIPMEPPVSFEAGPVRDREEQVMRAIRSDRARARPGERALRASTAPASSGQARSRATGRRRAWAPDSKTETYAALRLIVDNWRWAGVPSTCGRASVEEARERDRDPLPADAPLIFRRDPAVSSRTRS